MQNNIYELMGNKQWYGASKLKIWKYKVFFTGDTPGIRTLQGCDTKLGDFAKLHWITVVNRQRNGEKRANLNTGKIEKLLRVIDSVGCFIITIIICLVRKGIKRNGGKK